MKEMTTTAVIIGSGPAGVVPAIVFGKNKVPTILVDKKPKDLIGDKPCGDALSMSYTKMLQDMTGIEPPKGNEVTDRTEKTVLRGKTEKAQLILHQPSQTVDRHIYGQRLLKEALSYEDVTLLDNARFLDVHVEDGWVTGVTVLTPNGEIKINAKLVIDASGYAGVVRKKLPEGYEPDIVRKISKREMIVAYRDIIETPQKHAYQKGFYLLYFDDLPMPGYYWAFSKGPKQLNVGMGYLMTPENDGKNLKEINARIRDREFPGAKILKSQGYQIPARLPLYTLVGNGFMATGDAAALANPVSGEGHGPALLSGAKAALTAVQAIKENKPLSKENLWDYNEYVWKTFGVEFTIGIAIIKFFSVRSFDDFNFFLEKGMIREEDVKVALHEPTSRLSIMKRALKGITRPMALWKMKKALDISEALKQLAMNYPKTPEGFPQWKAKVQALEQKKI